MLLLSIIINIISGIIFHITIPLWLSDDSDPIGVLLISGMFFMILFLILMLYFSKKWTYEKYNLNTLLKISLCDAINSILIIYASQTNKVFAGLQSLLVNFSIFSSIACNKIILNDKKMYNNKYVLSSVSLILTSILTLSLPELLNSKVENLMDFLIWICIYLVGITIYTATHVYQTQYYNNYKKNTTDESEIKIGWNESKYKFFDVTFTFLFYETFFRLVILTCFIWTDLIPFFGYSSLSNISHNLHSTFKNSFSGNILFYFLSCNIFYVLSYIACAYTNVNSAPFTMITMVLVAPFVVFFWLLFPNIDPSSQKTQIEFAMPSLICAVIGVLIWKKWEEQNAEESHVELV